MNNRFLIGGLCFAYIILSGFWLNRTGRPLNVLILTTHKLTSVAAVVYLIVIVYRAHQLSALSPTLIAACAVALVCFAIMIATGGLLSTAKPMPPVILKTHQIMPYLVLLASTASLYLLPVRVQ